MADSNETPQLTSEEKNNITGILKQIVKDRENLARKTVLIEKIQGLLDAHYGWENENAIDD